MAQVTFKGNPVNTQGDFPSAGSKAADFEVTTQHLSKVTLASLAGKKVMLNFIPSIDTSVCATQLQTFSQKITDTSNIVVLFISLDLPFAYSRFCAAQGIDNVITGSDFQTRNAATHYGIQMTDGPLAGLYARAVLVIDEQGIIKYSELVAEVTNEPDYDKALNALHS